MEVILEQVGKRYSNKEWIFKDLNYHFRAGDKVAITGHNGSGKSTLLKAIGGMTLPSKGKVSYIINNEPLPAEKLLHHIAFASPYLELIEEFSLSEMLSFHFQFKQIRNALSQKDLIDILYLQGNESKIIKNFSSGMKQRLKLGLCFYTEASLILLDEPCSNLDQRGQDWYRAQIQQLPDDTLLFIASNQPEEYASCSEIIHMA